MCNLVTSMFFCKCLYASIVLSSYVVAGGQCVDIILLLALFYMVTLKYLALCRMVAVYFGLLIYAKNA